MNTYLGACVRARPGGRRGRRRRPVEGHLFRRAICGTRHVPRMRSAKRRASPTLMGGKPGDDAVRQFLVHRYRSEFLELMRSGTGRYRLRQPAGGARALRDRGLRSGARAAGQGLQACGRSLLSEEGSVVCAALKRVRVGASVLEQVVDTNRRRRSLCRRLPLRLYQRRSLEECSRLGNLAAGIVIGRSARGRWSRLQPLPAGRSRLRRPSERPIESGRSCSSLGRLARIREDDDCCALAKRLARLHVRVDTIEQCIRVSGGRLRRRAAGYVAAYGVLKTTSRSATPVIADSRSMAGCDAGGLARRGRPIGGTGGRGGGRLLGQGEHRRRRAKPAFRRTGSDETKLGRDYRSRLRRLGIATPRHRHRRRAPTARRPMLISKLERQKPGTTPSPHRLLEASRVGAPDLALAIQPSTPCVSAWHQSPLHSRCAA